MLVWSLDRVFDVAAVHAVRGRLAPVMTIMAPVNGAVSVLSCAAGPEAQDMAAIASSALRITSSVQGMAGIGEDQHELTKVLLAVNKLSHVRQWHPFLIASTLHPVDMDMMAHVPSCVPVM